MKIRRPSPIPDVRTSVPECCVEYVYVYVRHPFGPTPALPPVSRALRRAPSHSNPCSRCVISREAQRTRVQGRLSTSGPQQPRTRDGIRSWDLPRVDILRIPEKAIDSHRLIRLSARAADLAPGELAAGGRGRGRDRPLTHPVCAGREVGRPRRRQEPIPRRDWGKEGGRRALGSNWANTRAVSVPGLWVGPQLEAAWAPRTRLPLSSPRLPGQIPAQPPASLPQGLGDSRLLAWPCSERPLLPPLSALRRMLAAASGELASEGLGPELKILALAKLGGGKPGWRIGSQEGASPSRRNARNLHSSEKRCAPACAAEQVKSTRRGSIHVVETWWPPPVLLFPHPPPRQLRL